MSDRADRYLHALERILELSSVDFRTALTGAADVVAATMRAEKVDVFVLDEKDTLVAEGTSRTPLGAKQKALGLDVLPVANGGRAAKALGDGAPCLTPDASKDPEELRGVVEALGVRCTLHVPFTFGEGGRRAVLSVASAEPGRFDEADLRFATTLARWISVVGHRAELTQQLTGAAREEGRQAAAEEIVTVVAHDLRNVLSPALGRVQLLKRRAARDQHAATLRDAEAAERSLLRASRVIGDLLEVARIDQGLFELAPGVVDLVPLVEEVSRAVSEPGKDVVIAAPPELVVPGDAARLQQVFENLLANAQKHARSGTSVTVEATIVRDDPPGAEPWAQVDVVNVGNPIPPELVSKVFARYVRERGSQGLGLGLHLAREIVIAHGGTIGVEPSTSGARFRVRLPAPGA